MAETREQEIVRLNAEIAERQARIAELVLGDPREGVTMPILSEYVTPSST